MSVSRSPWVPIIVGFGDVVVRGVVGATVHDIGKLCLTLVISVLCIFHAFLKPLMVQDFLVLVLLPPEYMYMVPLLSN